jgi:putative ABC transport system permease protein
MNLLQISLRNLRVRLLSTTLTTLSIAAGAALLAVIWLMIGEARDRYRASTEGFSAIVGPQDAAPLSVVLNTVFNIGYSPGIVPYRIYRELREPANRNKYTLRAVIPQARGDQFGGFAIVGTTDEMFHVFSRERDENRKAVPLQFATGESWVFSHDDLEAFVERKAEHERRARAGASDGGAVLAEPLTIEPRHKKAVLGYAAAERLELAVGDAIVPVHGEKDDPMAHEHDEARCEVVGVLARTGTPLDRAIYIPLSTFLSLDGHTSIRPGTEADAENVTLTAVILDTVSEIKATRLRYDFQSRNDAQVAWPLNEIASLLQIVGDVTKLLEIVAQVVMFVAAISILVSLYNTMNERRREIAIMRSLGARRSQIARIVLQEAVMIPLVGAALGVLLGHVAVWWFGEWIAEKSGIPVDWAAFSPSELWLILGAGLLGGLAGILPAIKGSLTPVASSLGPTS